MIFVSCMSALLCNASAVRLFNPRYSVVDERTHEFPFLTSAVTDNDCQRLWSIHYLVELIIDRDKPLFCAKLPLQQKSKRWLICCSFLLCQGSPVMYSFSPSRWNFFWSGRSLSYAAVLFFSPSVVFLFLSCKSVRKMYVNSREVFLNMCVIILY